MLALALIGGGIKIVGSLINASRANKQSRAEDAYNQQQFNSNMQMSENDRQNTLLQMDQSRLQTQADLRGLGRQQNQQIGGMTAMSAASGIKTDQSSMGDIIDYENDQFLTAIDERERFGQIQLEGMENQLEDISTQQQMMRNQLQFGQQQSQYERRSNAWATGFDIAGTMVDVAGAGVKNNWWQKPAKVKNTSVLGGSR